ncbi:MAG: DUF2953 domain-containing protein [Thermoanaerobacteraceae bacterium]|nr:DUF2953 domain-containing protein [Thermoanaerobacteraceae bacterium]
MDPAKWSLLFGGLAGLCLLLLWPVKVEVSYHRREAEGGFLHLTLGLPWKSLSWKWCDISPSPWEILGEDPGLTDTKAREPFPVRSSGGRRLTTRSLLKRGTWLWWKLASVWGCFLGGTRCQSFRCIIEVGTGNPASTGVLAGVLWNLLGFFLQNLLRQTRGRFKPELDIIPHFGAVRWQAEFRCRLSFAAGRLILAGLKSALLLWRVARGIRRKAR